MNDLTATLGEQKRYWEAQGETFVGLLCAVALAAERRRQAAIEYDRRPVGSEAWHFYAGVFSEAVRDEDRALVDLTAHLREGSVADGE